MTRMTRTTVGVTGGVDTHGQSHHAAVIDHLGRQLGDREFPHRRWVMAPWWSGCMASASWIELALRAPATYGAGLARQLREAGILIVEVDRPDRRARRARIPLLGLRCLGLPRLCRSCATAGSRRSGRFAWHDPAQSEPEVRQRIKSNR